ncbi:MAG: ATP-binding protein [Georgfuchsia sp.]
MNHSSQANSKQLNIVANIENYGFAQQLLRAGFISALPALPAALPIFRRLEFSVIGDLERCFDDFALNLGWGALRLEGGNLILHGEGLFIEANGEPKHKHCFCSFELWADSVERAESAKAAILACSEHIRLTQNMFALSWNYLSATDGIKQVILQEIADDVLHDEAYPDIKQGVSKFIEAYLDAPEAVLVVQGNPGNGKTRLIRSILAQMSRRKGTPTKALYTTDCRILESDDIFRRFVNGLHDIFVLEDADYLLRPRADGNDNLHRFLGISDGLIRSQGRKIIFSTNLPNLRDIDDALIRPGRCFARIKVRELSGTEVDALLLRLCEGDNARRITVMESLAKLKRKNYSLAEIYRGFFDATSSRL